MWGRFPIIRQTDQSDCGPAVLATIAMWHNRPIGLQQMRELSGTDCIGTNLLGLSGAAEKLGFSAKAVKAPFEALSEIPLPAVAHVKTEEGLGHFVVLFQAKKASVVIGDPARGVERLSGEKFRQRWTGYLLLMTPEETGRSPDPASAPLSPKRRFFKLLAAHRNVLLEGFCCALLMTLLGVTTSYFVQHLVDSVLVRGETKLLNALGLGMTLIVLFRTLFGALRQYLLAHVSRKVDLSLISSYARHLLHLPMNFFEMRRVGEILSRVNDAAKVREAISGTTLTAMVDGVMVAVSLAVLWIYDGPLALVATAFVPLLAISVMSHHPASRTRSRQAMENAARLSSHLAEDVSGVETVKAFGAHRERTDEGEGRLVELVQSTFSLQKLGVSMNSLGMFVTGIAGIVILWYGGHRVVDGQLTIGELMFFYTLLGYMLAPLERLASVNLKIQDALVAIDRLGQIIDLAAEPSGDDQAEFKGVENDIELRELSFRYGCRSNVLEEVDLRIPAGARVALVGESGSGKSTLLKLLMRFYDPTEGRVLIDGTDMRDFNLESLRHRIGLVSQTPFIFNGTVRENIALGKPRASMDEILQAARSAGLDEFIAELPERYETVIGERGANLSGGQRQRLAIAWALLRDPDILIFDEATSHLDTATERAIQENLETAFAGKTVILVAHRLSTIRNADVIYYLHAGRVCESGRHAELLEMNGRYAELWRSQSDQDRAGTSYKHRLLAAEVEHPAYVNGHHRQLTSTGS